VSQKESLKEKGGLLVWLVNMLKPPDSVMSEESSIRGSQFIQKINCCFLLHSEKAKYK